MILPLPIANGCELRWQAQCGLENADKPDERMVLNRISQLVKWPEQPASRSGAPHPHQDDLGCTTRWRLRPFPLTTGGFIGTRRIWPWATLAPTGGEGRVRGRLEDSSVSYWEMVSVPRPRSGHLQDKQDQTGGSRCPKRFSPDGPVRPDKDFEVAHMIELLQLQKTFKLK